MSHHQGALALAGAQVAAVRDDPAARLALMARVLNPLDASPPGSVWWRAVNERPLRDGCARVIYAHAFAAAPRLAPDGSLRSVACSATPGSG